MTSRLTKSSAVLYGSSTPRIQSTPLVGRSLGGSVSQLADLIGKPLLPWQEHVLDQSLMIADDGRFVRTTCGVLVARQNGKTHLMRMRLLAGLFVFGEESIAGMAQNRQMALDTMMQVVDYAESHPALSRRIKKVSRTNGNEKFEVYCHHYPKACNEPCNRVRTYRVLAATPDNARGRSIDLLYVDELREISDKVWAAAAPTTRARPNPQTWITSNAGDVSSQVLNDMRSRALADASPRLGWWEWSAEPSRRITDRAGWQEANPSLGYLVNIESIEDSLARDSEDTFRTETLCQWIDGTDCPFNLNAFDSGMDKSLEMLDGRQSFAGIDFDFERKSAYMVTAQIVDGKIETYMHGWVRDETLNEREVASDIAEIARKFHIQQIAFDPRASGHIAPLLQQAGIRMTPTPWAGAEFATFCDITASAIQQQRIAHVGQPELRKQLALSSRRPAGDGGWRIARKTSGSIPAAIAFVLAVGNADRPRARITATIV